MGLMWGAGKSLQIPAIFFLVLFVDAQNSSKMFRFDRSISVKAQYYQALLCSNRPEVVLKILLKLRFYFVGWFDCVYTLRTVD